MHDVCFMSIKNGTALQRFIDSAINYVDIEKELEHVKVKTVSNPLYIDLFRVNRASQTDQQNIPNVKVLYCKMNLLIMDIQSTQKECRSMKSEMMRNVSDAISSQLKKEIKKIGHRLKESQKMIFSASRTKMGNHIAQITRDANVQRQQKLTKLNLAHQKQMNDIDKDIKALKRKLLYFESQTKKYKTYVEKTTLTARRAGIDVAAYNGDDTLEQLQNTLRTKLETVESMKKKLEAIPPPEEKKAKLTIGAKPMVGRLLIPKKPTNTETLTSPNTLLNMFCKENLVSISDAPETTMDSKIPAPVVEIKPEMSEKQLQFKEKQVTALLEKIQNEFYESKRQEEKITEYTIASLKEQFELLKRETKIILQEQQSVKVPAFFDVFFID